MLFRNVHREDEGDYEVVVSRRSTPDVPVRSFNYILIVMDKADYDISQLLDTADRECATPYLATRLRTPAWTPRCTPRCSPFHSPRSTPRTTPTRSLASPVPSEDEGLGSSFKKTHVTAKILSGLSDVLSAQPGSTTELKCYLLTVPGLETKWEKDGREVSDSGRIKMFESRGVRGLTIRSLREEDAGLYAVRIHGPVTNLYSSCRVSLSTASSGLYS